MRKLILFDPKCLKLDIFAQNFGKQMSDLKSSPSIEGTYEILLRLES